jgi:hypothetical protein
MPCIPEPFHKPARRKSFAVILADEEVQHICLDDASPCSFQGAEADVINNTGIGITVAKGADVSLYSGNQQRGGRQNLAAAGILSEQSDLYLKAKLSPLPEDDIWCLYGGQEAQALLPRASNLSGGRGSYLGDHKQKRCEWLDSQVGNRTVTFYTSV